MGDFLSWVVHNLAASPTLLAFFLGLVVGIIVTIKWIR